MNKGESVSFPGARNQHDDREGGEPTWPRCTRCGGFCRKSRHQEKFRKPNTKVRRMLHPPTMLHPNGCKITDWPRGSPPVWKNNRAISARYIFAGSVPTRAPANRCWISPMRADWFASVSVKARRPTICSRYCFNANPPLRRY